MKILPLIATSAALLALSACGGGSDDNSTTQGSTSQQDQQGQQSQTQQFQGASGKIAAINGTTLQVQNDTDGQVAVNYSDSTTFTAQVAASATDLQVGDCVTAMPDMSTATSGDSSTDSTTVAATTVRITQAVDGECTGGFGGFGGGGRFGGGNGGTPPTDLPQTQQGGGNGTPPSGGSQGGQAPDGTTMRRAFGAFGKVTAVSASGFTVESSFPTGAAGAQDDSQSGSSSTPQTQSVDVTYTADTTWTKTAAADATALAVGKCVTAQGDHDNTGAVTATTIQVSDAVDGECTSGRRVFQGGPGGQSGQSGTTTQQGAQS